MGLTVTGGLALLLAAGLGLLVLAVGCLLAWYFRPRVEVYNTRRRLEALLERDRAA